MKWMNFWHAEVNVDSAERSAAPFGVWRSEALHCTAQGEGLGEGLAVFPALADPAVQDGAAGEMVPAEERARQSWAQDEEYPVPIHQEGLLG